MSAMEDVNTTVTTLMEAITALVMMDTPSKMIPNALVRRQLAIVAYFRL